MTDLTLNEYKDLSEEELGLMLKKESKKMFHSDLFERDYIKISDVIHRTFQQTAMDGEQIIQQGRQIIPFPNRVTNRVLYGVGETLLNLAHNGFQIASRMYVHLFFRAS